MAHERRGTESFTYPVRGVASLDFDHRLPQRARNTHAPNIAVGTKLGDYIFIENKKHGIEPGFLGLHIDDMSRYMAMRLNSDIDPEKLDPFSRAEYLKAFLDTSDKEKKEIVELIVRDIKNRDFPRAKRYLFKQDYNDPDAFGLVTMTQEGAERTNAIKSIKQKWLRAIVVFFFRLRRKSRPATENRNVVLEVLANEIAAASGMKCQDQDAVFGTYGNGALKVVSRAVWQDGLRMLSDFKGGNYALGNTLIAQELDEHGNYLPLTTEDGLFVSDDSIKDLGRYLALFIAQGDRDTFGSKGSNKGRLGNNIFGLDFGQAYRGDNPLLKALKDDFSFKQPRGMTKVYKNFSMLYDTTLSDRMQGVHILNKLFYSGSDYQDPDCIRSFDPEFQQQLAQIEPGIGFRIFDEYAAKFQQQADQAPNKRTRRELKKLADEVLKTKKIAKATHAKMMDVFQDRLSQTKQELDLVRNIEALCAKSSLRSPDGTVLLNHIRMEERIPFKLKVKGNAVSIEGQCKNRRDAKRIKRALNAYLKNNDSGYRATVDGKKIKLKLPHDDLERIMEIFHEDQIKQHKHPEDFAQYQTFCDLHRTPSKRAEVRRSYAEVARRAGIEHSATKQSAQAIVSHEPEPTLLSDQCHKILQTQLQRKGASEINFSQTSSHNELNATLPAPSGKTAPTRIKVTEHDVKFSQYDPKAHEAMVDSLFTSYGTDIEITLSKMTAEQLRATNEMIERVRQQHIAQQRSASNDKPQAPDKRKRSQSAPEYREIKPKFR